MTIQQALNRIRTAVLGREVRSALHDGIEFCHSERLPGGFNPVSNLNDFASGLGYFTMTNSSPTNKPSFTGNVKFLLIAAGNDTNSTQIAFDMEGSNPPLKRRKQNNTWTSWSRLDGTSS